MEYSIAFLIVRQKWTLSVINWRLSSVEPSWQYLRRSMLETSSLVMHTVRHPCLQHYAREASRRAGPSAITDTCEYMFQLSLINPRDRIVP